MYKNILVAIDLGHGAAGKAMAERALKLLDPAGKLRLLHVTEDIPTYVMAELPMDVRTRREAEARVEMNLLATSLAAPAGTIITEVRSGAAAGEILAAAEDSGADLIVIASHRPGLSDYFMGSTAARVVRHAQCSVLIGR